MEKNSNSLLRDGNTYVGFDSLINDTINFKIVDVDNDKPFILQNFAGVEGIFPIQEFECIDEDVKLWKLDDEKTPTF